MKIYTLKSNTRLWTSGLVAATLGLSGLALMAEPPAASPKAPADSQQLTNTAPQAGDTSPQGWDDQAFDRMRHIQQEMDDLFRTSMGDLDSTADRTFLTGPKFDASATVQDRGDHYEASFYLPKRDLSNVKVKISDGMLSVDASSEQTTRSATTTGKAPAEQSEMLSQYEQIISLPGPVDAGKMQVKKQGDSLIVTIPKKDSATASNR